MNLAWSKISVKTVCQSFWIFYWMVSLGYCLIDNKEDIRFDLCSSGSGKRFVFMILDNLERKSGFVPILFMTSATSRSTTVRIYSPIWSSASSFSYVKTLPDVGYIQQSLPNNIVMTNFDKDDKSIIVEAEDYINLFVLNDEYLTIQGYVVYPESTLGSTYVGVSFQSLDSNFKALLGVTATLPSTVLDIQVPVGLELVFGGITYSGSSFQVTLNQYETALFSSDFLTGVIVTSVDNKAIAVIAGHQFLTFDLQMNSDGYAEMLLPTNLWSNSFLAFTDSIHYKDQHLLIINGENTNKLRLETENKAEETIDLQPFGFHEIQLPVGNSIKIEAQSAIQVYQTSPPRSIVGAVGDFTMFTVTSLRGFLSRHYFVAPIRKYDLMFVFILTQVAARENLMLDGKYMHEYNVEWRVTVDPDFCWARVSIDANAHRLEFQGEGTMAAYIVGLTTLTQFATPAGQGFSRDYKTLFGSGRNISSYNAQQTAIFRQVGTDRVAGPAPYSVQTCLSAIHCQLMCLREQTCEIFHVTPANDSVMCRLYDSYSFCEQRLENIGSSLFIL